MFVIPANSIAAKCSRVWGWGHFSFAAIINNAPSITVAPDNIVAINASCPGESTKLTALINSHLVSQFGHFILEV